MARCRIGKPMNQVNFRRSPRLPVSSIPALVTIARNSAHADHRRPNEMPLNDCSGLLEVAGNRVGSEVSPGIYESATVSRSHQDREGSNPMSQLKVTLLVTNHKRLGGTEVQLCSGLQDESRFRFPARTTVVRVMRTGKEPIESDPASSKEVFQTLVNLL